MTDTREQIIEQMARADFATEAAKAMLPVAVKAVTDRVREIATTQAIACHATPGEYGPERPWLDLLAMLDQIDAEMGVRR